MHNYMFNFSSYNRCTGEFCAPACFAASDNIFATSDTVITAVSVFLLQIIVQILKNIVCIVNNKKSKLPII